MKDTIPTHFCITALLLASANIGTVRSEELGPPSPAPAPPKRPADFTPFRFAFSAEQLREKFSGDQMKRAEAELKEIQAVNEKGPWKPTWESLDKHRAPEWFLDVTGRFKTGRSGSGQNRPVQVGRSEHH